jgi:hypothetical protein
MHALHQGAPRAPPGKKEEKKTFAAGRAAGATDMHVYLCKRLLSLCSSPLLGVCDGVCWGLTTQEWDVCVCVC